MPTNSDISTSNDIQFNLVFKIWFCGDRNDLKKKAKVAQAREKAARGVWEPQPR